MILIVLQGEDEMWRRIQDLMREPALCLNTAILCAILPCIESNHRLVEGHASVL